MPRKFCVLFSCVLASLAGTSLFAQAASQPQPKADVFEEAKAILAKPDSDEKVAKAIVLLRKAAMAGNNDAAFWLGRIYSDGKLLQPIPERAILFARQGAGRGDARCMMLMSSFYSKGIGVGVNKEEAGAWLRKAADAGYPGAKELVAQLEARQAPESVPSTPTRAPAREVVVVDPPKPAAPESARTPARTTGREPDRDAARNPVAPKPLRVVGPSSVPPAAPGIPDAEQRKLPADLQKEFQALNALGRDSLWAGGASAPVSIPVHAEPADTAAAFKDLASLSGRDYLLAATMAKEGHRMMLGDMDARQLRQFNAKWAPILQNPTEDLRKYLDALNPLLAEFQYLRGQVAASAEAFDSLMDEAAMAAALENEDGVRLALSQARTTRQQMLACQSRMAEVAAAVQALGEPPDPLANKARARKRHEDAIQQVKDVAVGDPGPCWVLQGVLKGKEAAGRSPGGGVIEWNGDLSAIRLEGNHMLWTIHAQVFSDGGDSAPVVARNGTVSSQGPVWWTEPPPRLAPVSSGDWDDAGKLFPAGSLGFDRGYKNASDVEARQDLFRSMTRRGRAGTCGITVLVPELCTASFLEQARARNEVVGNLGDIGVYFWLESPVPAGGRKVSLRQQMHHARFDAATVVPGSRYSSVTCPLFIPPPADPKDASGGQSLTLSVSTSYTRPIIKYVYRWDPTGGTFEPYKRPDAAEVADLDEVGKSGSLEAKAIRTKAAKVVAKDDKPRPKQADPVAVQVRFYEENIALWQKDIEAYRRQMDAARSEKDRQYFQWLVMGREANVQQERDRIATLRTGEFVHTPTAWEGFCQMRSEEIFRAESEKREAMRRYLHGADKLVSLLPPDKQAVARDELQKELMRVAGSGDPGAARAVVDKVLKRAARCSQADFAKHQARGDEAEALEQAAGKLKGACDTSLMFMSMGGGRPVLYAYKAATGYVEGGVAQAVKETVRTYSNAANYACVAMEGYQDGGAEGAAKRVASQWLLSKTMEKAAGCLFAGRAPTGPSQRVRDQFEAAKFKQELEWGRAQVRQFADAQKRLVAAGQSGADATTITKLQAEARELAVKLNSSPMAKNILKYQAEGPVARAFDTHVRTVYAKVDHEAEQAMIKEGWNMKQLVVRDFRNESSLGTVNMDRDYGLDTGRTLALQGTDRMRLVQNGERRSMLEWEEAMSKAYGKAYQKATGYTADSGWQLVTSGANKEAFKDVAVLSGNMRQADRAWIGQTADVITYKTTVPFSDKGNASFSHWLKLQESSRGFGKELEKKILPVLRDVKPGAPKGTPEYKAQAERMEATVRHLESVKALCDEFGKGGMDPLVFRDRFAELTGGKGVTQVASEVGTLIEGAAKFNATK